MDGTKINIFSEWLRADNRKPFDIKRMDGNFGVVKKASGSAYVEQGKTQVLVAVYGPLEIRPRVQPPKMVVNCQCSKSSFSLPSKKKTLQGHNLTEFARNLKQIFESAIISQFYINSQIDIFVEILQDDGSLLATSINATTLALTDAGIKLKGLVCSCSCGSMDGKTLIDPSLSEEEQSPLWLTIATLPSVHNQMLLNSLKGKLHESQFNEITSTLIKACRDVMGSMEEFCAKKFKESDK